MTALIIVDIQNDFTKGGALEVPQGEGIIPIVNELQTNFDIVVATQDWHPKDHKSFASNHPNGNVFSKIDLDGLEQVLWPDHCVQGTTGAEFHSALDTKRIEAIIRKGMDSNIDSYSGFYDNGHRKNTGLAGYLHERSIKEVFICGLAGDYCVFYTALDAIKEGFTTNIIEGAVKSISEADFKRSKEVLISNGAKII